VKHRSHSSLVYRVLETFQDSRKFITPGADDRRFDRGLGAAERRGQPSTKALLASSETVLSSRRSLCVMEEYDSTAEK